MKSDILFLLLFLGFAIIIFVFFFMSIKSIYTLDITFIELGKKDSEILEFKKKKRCKLLGKIGFIATTIFTTLLVSSSLTFVILNNTTNPLNVLDFVPITITSGSMSAKDDKNTYLVENDLNNQFPTGSIIILHKLPEKNNLKKYDVVAYKTKEKILVIHRIIDFGYYEKDEKGNEVWRLTNNIEKANKFVFRGDNNTANDPYYIDYKDMYGIYNDEYCSALGYVVEYIQSYFGLISVVAIATIIEAYEYFDRKTKNKIDERYMVLSGNFGTIGTEEDSDEVKNTQQEEVDNNKNSEEDNIEITDSMDADVVEESGEGLSDEDEAISLSDDEFDTFVQYIVAQKDSDENKDVIKREKNNEEDEETISIDLNEDREDEGIKDGKALDPKKNPKKKAKLNKDFVEKKNGKERRRTIKKYNR